MDGGARCARRVKTICESSLVLVALVIVLALLTVASGYAAFYASGGVVWDVVLLAASASFLVVFIRFLMTLAAATMRSGGPSSAGTGDMPPDADRPEREESRH